MDIDDNDLPVSFAFVEKGHNTEDLDLLHLTDITNLLTNLTDIEGIVITLSLGLSMSLAGIFPSLNGC